MPVIVDEGDYSEWLGQEPADPDELRAILQPYPASELVMWAISDRVNKLSIDEPSVLDPSDPT